jgi:hypothetical protein
VVNNWWPHFAEVVLQREGHALRAEHVDLVEQRLLVLLVKLPELLLLFLQEFGGHVNLVTKNIIIVRILSNRVDLVSKDKRRIMFSANRSASNE